MNARVDVRPDGAPTAQESLQLALHDIMNDVLFARAPRTCKLLQFLVEKKLAHKEDEITEHAIGLAVFRRDGRSYDTTLDPVVRVQMGRLRARLDAYYATHPAASVRVSVPLGSYVPVCTNNVAAPAVPQSLQVAPLRNLAGASQAFVAGVDEELGSQLFHALGSLVQLQRLALERELGTLPGHHRLEGSIRVERNHVRASMRLVDTRAGAIAWLSQFDCNGELNMSLQEQLATAICVKLQTYLQANAA